MRQALRSWVLACAMITGIASECAQDGVAYVMGRSPAALYEIDLGTGGARLVGEVSFPGQIVNVCAGLAWNLQGRLMTVCNDFGAPSLTILDPENAQVLNRRLFHPNEDRRRRWGPADLALRPSDGALLALEIAFPIIGLPPAPVVFNRLSRISLSGEILEQIELNSGLAETTFAPFGIDFPPQSDLPLSIGRTFDGPALSSVDPATGPTGSVQPIQRLANYQDLAFDPSSGRLLAVWDERPFEGSFLGVIEDDGSVSVIAELPFRTTSIGFKPESQEWILPSLAAIQAGKLLRIQSSLSLANSSNLVAASRLEVFDSRGAAIALEDVSCSHPESDPSSFEMAPRSQMAVTIGGAKSGFSGWARLRSTGPGQVRPQVQLSLLRASAEDCPLIDTVSSHDILTTVYLSATRPGLEFSASGAITEFRESAFSLVNPSADETALIHVVANREDGTPFDANEIHLEPGHRLSLMLFELLIEGKNSVLPPLRPTDFRGQVRFSSDVAFAVGAQQVLLPEGKWTELTVVAR